MPSPVATYTVATYLVARLAALGAKHVFGVPGNYTAAFLSAVKIDGRMTYVGTTNEQEAGYAADALSRVERIAVACVTYGVGSFSLYNATAGAYVERCPVVVVNGTANAAKRDQFVRQGVLFAHAIDPLRTDEAIFTPITADRAVILDPRDAPRLIDRVLRACVAESQPVYLEAPDDVWNLPCAAPVDPDKALEPLPLSPSEEHDVEVATAAAVAAVVELARQAKHPVLWGGEWLQRLNLGPQFQKLVELTGWPYTTTLLGKGLIPENNPQFIGVYDSAFAPADIQQVVEGSDRLIALGTILSDFYGKIVGKSFDRMVLAAGRAVRVGNAVYPNVPLKRFVAGLVEAFTPGSRFAATEGHEATAPVHTPPPHFEEVRESRARRRQAAPVAGFAEGREAPEGQTLPIGAESTAASPPSTPLTWDLFFTAMRRRSWKGWRILVDTSSALFPSAELLIEEADRFIAQTCWLSIGYTTGGALGASCSPDNARVAAFVGDGGFQMGPQVLSTLARQKSSSVLFVFDNGLYAIEQYLIDKTYFEPSGDPPLFFNELPQWDYVKLAESFGAKGISVATTAELYQALRDIDAAPQDGPWLVAVKLTPTDLPAELKATVTPATGLGAAPASFTEGAPGEPGAAPATVAPAAFN